MSSAVSGVKRLTVNSLSLNSTDFFIIGIIIAKRAAKSFLSKQDGTERGVLGLTVRDSPADYINVTIWGSREFIESVSGTFKIGDVVDLINVKVTTRKHEEDRYQPPTTCCLELVFNESHSQISYHNSDDVQLFKSLLHLPTKPLGHFLSLMDVKSNGKTLSGQFVNLLVAVKRVGVPRTVRTKTMKTVHCLEVQVMDTTHAGFSIQLWDQDNIEMALSWLPRETCLFLSDIRIDWSDFRKAMTGTVTSKTIITENPHTTEAKALARYAASAPISARAIVDATATVIQPETIVNVMSCDTILKRTADKSCSESFTALVFAIVTSFDLDGTNVIQSKCTICDVVVRETCTNPDCANHPLFGLNSATYDFLISIADHTNSLEKIKLSGETAARLIGHTAEDFLQLLPQEKIELKWKFLLKQVAARLVILPTPWKPDTYYISVANLSVVHVQDYAQRAPIY